MTASSANPASGADAGERAFTFARNLDAPRDRVWKAFTEREHLMHWWGPKGFIVRDCTLDLQPGGLFHYCLVSPGGQEMWGKFVYREISAPERLHFIVSFSDEHGGVTRHPWDQHWPLETLSTIGFAEQNGGTRVTIRWVPHNATEAERNAFEAGREGAQQGWSGTMQRLAEYLAPGAEGRDGNAG